MLVYLSAKLPEEKRLVSVHSAKTVLLSVSDYFDSFEQCDGGRGALSRTSEATGEQTLYCCVLW